MVISEQMGEKYNELWGKRPYEVITDGLSQLASVRKERPAKSLRVYFMGSVHISYHENFIALGKALDLIAAQKSRLESGASCARKSACHDNQNTGYNTSLGNRERCGERYGGR